MSNYGFRQYVENREIVLDPFVLEHLTLEDMENLMTEIDWQYWKDRGMGALKGGLAGAAAGGAGGSIIPGIGTLAGAIGGGLTGAIGGGLKGSGAGQAIGQGAQNVASGLGSAARGVANLPNYARAAYHGIDPNDATKYAQGVNDPAFQRDLAGKQYGLDPSSYTGGPKGQEKWDKDLAAAKYSAMSPSQKTQHWQAQQYDAQQQNQLAQMQHQGQMQGYGNQVSAAQRQSELSAAQQKAKQAQDPAAYAQQQVPQIIKNIEAKVAAMKGKAGSKNLQAAWAQIKPLFGP